MTALNNGLESQGQQKSIEQKRKKQLSQCWDLQKWVTSCVVLAESEIQENLERRLPHWHLCRAVFEA